MIREHVGATEGQTSSVARTDDGRYIVVNGRRWRATDPSIPEALSAELRRALMAARRAVGHAQRGGVDAAADRRRVDDAKVALGERGHPWWKPATDLDHRRRAASTIRTLVEQRSNGSVCPSDVARVIGGRGWRGLMPLVRDVARRMADEGSILITQGGRPVQGTVRGPIRLAAPSPNPSAEPED